MQSKLKLFSCAAALVGASVFTTAAIVRAQEESPDPAEMMMKMMELATPGPEHAELAKKVGAWEQQYKMKWDPNAPWMDAAGTSEATSVLGGRFIMEKIKSEMPGMGPFEGLQLFGFDKMSGEYISLWADSMSTWWVESRGKENPDGTIEMKGTMKDVMGQRPFRMVIKPKGETENDIEMYDTIMGKEVLVMQIHSKKK